MFSGLNLRTLIFGTGGGLASAALFYSAAKGSVGLSILLFLLTPLPSLIAGFGWGLGAASAASAAGALVMAFAVSPAFAFGYLLALGLPVAGITHLIFLARYDTDGALIGWYPAGRVMAAIALYGALLPALLVQFGDGSFRMLEPDFVRFFKQLSAQAPIGSSWRAIDDQRLQTLAALWVQGMPAAIASYWTLFIAINVYLAGRVTRLSGLLVRPWPDFKWMSYPAGLAALFGLALAGIWFGGVPRLLGAGAAGALFVAFLLLGLSVAHAVGPARATWLLYVVYGTLAVAGYVAAPLTAFVGLLESVAHLRARLVPVPSGLPPGTI